MGANPLSANQIIRRAAASIPVMGQLAKSAATAVDSNLVSTGMVDLKLAMQALLIGVIIAFICRLYCGCTWRRVPRQVTTSSILATVGDEPREPYIPVHFSDDSVPETEMPTRTYPLDTPEFRHLFRTAFPNRQREFAEPSTPVAETFSDTASVDSEWREVDAPQRTYFPSDDTETVTHERAPHLVVPPLLQQSVRAQRVNCVLVNVMFDQLLAQGCEGLRAWRNISDVIAQPIAITDKFSKMKEYFIKMHNHSKEQLRFLCTDVHGMVDGRKVDMAVNLACHTIKNRELTDVPYKAWLPTAVQVSYLLDLHVKLSVCPESFRQSLMSKRQYINAFRSAGLISSALANSRGLKS